MGHMTQFCGRVAKKVTNPAYMARVRITLVATSPTRCTGIR